MKMDLAPGAAFSFDYDTRRRDLVCFLFKRAKWDWILRWRHQPSTNVWRRKPKVIATGVVVGLVEWAAMELIRRTITTDEDSLGTAVSIQHKRAVRRGETLRIIARCAAIDGARSHWIVYAYKARELTEDATEPKPVAHGTVGFHVIDTEEFLARVTQSAWRRSRVRPRFCHRWWVLTKSDLRGIVRWCRPGAKRQAPVGKTSGADIADTRQQERVGVLSGSGSTPDRDNHHPGR